MQIAELLFCFEELDHSNPELEEDYHKQLWLLSDNRFPSLFQESPLALPTQVSLADQMAAARRESVLKKRKAREINAASEA